MAHIKVCPQYGIGLAVDIENKCRFYDLIRFKKMAKVSASGNTKSRADIQFSGNSSFCLFVPDCMFLNNEYLVSVTQTPTIGWDETHKLFLERTTSAMQSLDGDTGKKKGGKKEKVEEVEEVPEVPPEEIPHFSEKDILVKGKYSDDKDSLKSLREIVETLPSNHMYYHQKSQISLYNLEDIIFNLFPALQTHKRRAANTRDIFLNNDPFAKD